MCVTFELKKLDCENIDIIIIIKESLSLRLFTIAFLATRGVLRIFNTTCKTLSALITCSSSSVAASREEQRSEGTKKRICLVASRKREEKHEFLSRQENGAYIAVNCNAVDRLSPIHSSYPRHARLKKEQIT